MKEEKEEIKELKAQIVAYEKLIEDLSAPIIPSIVPDTILVPLMGALSVERFGNIQRKIVQSIAEQPVHTVIIDFTSIGALEVEEKMSYEKLSGMINELVSLLKLMDAEALFVGFSPAFAQNLVLSNASTYNQIKAFVNFREGLQYLLKKKGMELIQK